MKILAVLPLSPPLVVEHGQSPSSHYMELAGFIGFDDGGQGWYLVYAIERSALAELPPRLVFKRWQRAEEIPFAAELKPIGPNVPLHVYEQMQASALPGRRTQ